MSFNVFMVGKFKLTFHFFLFCLIVISIYSCFDIIPDYRDRISFIDSVHVSDSVRLGEAFYVTIVTSAPNGCWKQGHDEVQKQLNGYRIIPYDQEYLGSNMCPQAVVNFIHNVSLVIEKAADHQIEIQHRTWGSAGQDSIGTVVKNMVVY